VSRARADVAVYAPHAAPFYSTDGENRIGGAELQTVLIGRALVQRGFRVRHIVFSGAPLVRERDGVAVVPIAAAYDRGGLKRRRAIAESLRSADADVYVQRSAGFGTGMVGMFARAQGRRFIFSSSSEADFKLDAATTATAGASLDRWPTRLEYRIGLRLANAIVVQTEQQAQLAREATGRAATVIANLASIEPVAERPRRPVFLWTGQLVDFKDPLAYIRLASLVPEAEFSMIATDRGSAWNDLAWHVGVAAERTPNLTLLAPRPRRDLAELYASVTALVSTSKFEGFPNTFLEAWSQATPTLSLTVDPDGVIQQHELGVVADGSLERLAAAVRAYRSDPTTAAAAGARARAYVATTHDPETLADRWAALIDSLRHADRAAR
jgi:glycosyltransferase involved in cell wall biosynthesis